VSLGADSISLRAHIFHPQLNSFLYGFCYIALFHSHSFKNFTFKSPFQIVRQNYHGSAQGTSLNIVWMEDLRQILEKAK
jgi:hypothetical protein